ncbi:MAG TPA: PHP domain-containing protein [Pseudonocardiaceae bacterium]
MTSDFVHLHVHTEYSMLDGAARLADLFAETQRLGMSAVGLTDHGNMGEFNWSSQHLGCGGVDGSASGVDEGVDGQVADEVAGAPGASAGCRAHVLV